MDDKPDNDRFTDDGNPHDPPDDGAGMLLAYWSGLLLFCW